MTAKVKVRQIHPRAHHRRYRTPTGGYTIIWAKFGENHRLATGKTTAEAWRNAVKNMALQPTLEGRLSQPLTSTVEAIEQLKTMVPITEAAQSILDAAKKRLGLLIP